MRCDSAWHWLEVPFMQSARGRAERPIALLRAALQRLLTANVEIEMQKGCQIIRMSGAF
jgi:hypothetical protein